MVTEQRIFYDSIKNKLNYNWEKIVKAQIQEFNIQQQSNINKIIVHCTATPITVDYTLDRLMCDHTDRGFSTFGYHIYIRKNGEVYYLRPINYIGSHCYGYNKNSIGVCYEGGVDKNLKGLDTRTDSQKKQLQKILLNLMNTYKIKNNVIYGHHDFNKNKECPCFNVKKEYENLGNYILN